MPATPRQGRLFATGVRGPVARSRRDADATIAALRALGRLEAADQLLVSLIRTAADVADEKRADPDATYHLNAALKLLADLEARLRGVGATTDDGFADLLAAVTGPPPAGHPPD